MPIANTGLVIVLLVVCLGLAVFDHVGGHERPYDWQADHHEEF